MVDFLSVFKKTGAYKILTGDKTANRLSHAYLFITPDKDNLIEYLKLCAKTVLCKESEPCEKCRNCRLIEQRIHSDVKIYPQNGESVVVDDVADLIEESYIKPIEADKKVFIINHAETMNVQSQNKLLKTLEEPPKNVIIIIGATGEYSLLPTIRSRVKKLEMQAFKDEDVFFALEKDYTDKDLLKKAVFSGDGTLGKAVKNYCDSEFLQVRSVVLDTLVNMKSSKNLLTYSDKISALKRPAEEVIDVFELFIKDIFCLAQGQNELIKNEEILQNAEELKSFTLGASVYALEKIAEAKKRKKSNVNSATVIEWLLFQILEGKYKWRK